MRTNRYINSITIECFVYLIMGGQWTLVPVCICVLGYVIRVCVHICLIILVMYVKKMYNVMYNVYIFTCFGEPLVSFCLLVILINMFKLN